MVVLIVTAVKPGLRGELSRWMLEPQAGVFVGHLSGRVRDKLWEKVVAEVKSGSAMMIHSARSEQGFAVRCHGDRARLPMDYDGLVLIARRTAKAT
ncbi:MAG: type I-E CRISPR-associated endoribonuclease Cas2 [Armatimonadetes bacterium]|nr:type I-E CRISPR-associated endoribonuclease Cas2 [Armatimonadota bacterium]MBX3107839.1 type I-E CRISPR-associated endoribonuclease Cas2 [Fimbriimonadaceae bacterium]